MKGAHGCEMKDVEIFEQMAQIDWWYVLAAFVLLLLAIKLLWSLFDWFVFDKLGIETKKMKEQRENKEQLKKTTELAEMTAKNLDRLEKRHTKDEAEFRNNLNNYMAESRKDRKALHDEMTKFTNNRMNDRKQSLEIQKELKNTVAARDVQIEALVIANKEMLAEKINEKLLSD